MTDLDIRRLNAIAPLPVWGLCVAATVVLVVTFYRAIRKRRTRTMAPEDRAARIQLIAALAFCGVVIASFMIGTYQGGVAFAGDKLGWTDWRRTLPWGALDAASIGFSLFAIRAIGRGRSPRSAQRVVYLTASFSAGIQLMEGGSLHTWQGGTFLAGLAAMSAMVLHNVMDQLRDKDTDDVADGKSPRFGKRWATSFVSTLCAWLAWANYPPAETVRPTVANAIDHLDDVRAWKASRRSPRGRLLTPWRTTRLALAEADRLAEKNRELAAEVTAANARVADAEERVAAREKAPREATEKRAESPTGKTRTGPAEATARARNSRAEVSPRQDNSQVVNVLTSDEEIAERLLDSFAEYTAENGSHPRPYWVQKNGECWPRQSVRVQELLVRMHAEKDGRVGRGEGGPSSASDESVDDSERESVESTG